MKKIFLTIILGLSIAVSSFAQSGTIGSLSWSINDGTLTISGTGAMPDYDWPTYPWYYYTIRSVVISKGVTNIGKQAFFCCNSLTSITIPNSVISIGDYAFFNCNSLTSITIPNSVKSIEWGTFNGCSSLTSITIPNSVTNIGEQAFSYCSSLTSISIPGDVIHIGKGAFAGSIGLTDIYSHRASPPQLDIEVFYDVDMSACTLHVLVGSKQYYEAAEYWKEFVNIVEDASMDITTITAPDRIGIYPNPVSDSFQLTGITDATEITIVDASGNAVISKVIAPSEDIFIDNLPTGIYFVQVAGKTIKLMKK